METFPRVSLHCNRSQLRTGLTEALFKFILAPSNFFSYLQKKNSSHIGMYIRQRFQQFICGHFQSFPSSSLKKKKLPRWIGPTNFLSTLMQGMTSLNNNKHLFKPWIRHVHCNEEAPSAVLSQFQQRPISKFQTHSTTSSTAIHVHH